MIAKLQGIHFLFGLCFLIYWIFPFWPRALLSHTEANHLAISFSPRAQALPLFWLSNKNKYNRFFKQEINSRLFTESILLLLGAAEKLEAHISLKKSVNKSFKNKIYNLLAGVRYRRFSDNIFYIWWRMNYWADNRISKIRGKWTHVTTINITAVKLSKQKAYYVKSILKPFGRD